MSMDLVSFIFQDTPLGKIKIQLLFAFWKRTVARFVKATSSTDFPKTLSARQMVGQEGKRNVICHADLHLRSWEESESSWTGSWIDLPPSAETLVTARLAWQEVWQLVLTRAAGSDKSGEKWICHIPDLFQFMIEMKDAEL